MASMHKGVAAGILFLFLFGFVQAEKGEQPLKCQYETALGMESYGVPDNHLNWSSAWNDYENGRFGRLNRKQNDRGWLHAGGWVVGRNPEAGKEWLEVQFPKFPVIVTGVATQGRNGGFENWVTKYKLGYFDFSANKIIFYREKGHKEDKEFDGNTDRDTVVRHKLKSPFQTNATRFLVLAWHSHPAMRVEVYGCRGFRHMSCLHGKPLGMESGVIPNENIKTSSAWSANEDEKFSRLNTKEARHTAGSWVSLKNQIGEWLEINLENPAIVTDLATQGRNGRHVQWVTKYKLEYFDVPTNNPVFYHEGGKKEVKEFAGNTDQDTVVYHKLKPSIQTNRIRFVVLAWHKHISMRAEIYGCPASNDCEKQGKFCPRFTVCQKKDREPHECVCIEGFRMVEKGQDKICEASQALSCVNDKPLGMESGAIPNENIKNSSAWNSNEDAKFSRLNTKAAHHTAGSWVSLKKEIGEWLEINLGNLPAIITMIATQGRHGPYVQWVKRYKLQYVDDFYRLVYYTEEGKNKAKEFIANNDQNTVVFHELSPPAVTEKIRFLPTAWEKHISMRVELYGCKKAVDECHSSTGKLCPRNAICEKKNKGFHHCVCVSGFRRLKNAKDLICKDIDECAENKTIDCENNKVCQNTEGGFKCGCKSGERLAWTGYCVPLSECDKRGLECPFSGGTCQGSPSDSFVCGCDKGFKPVTDGERVTSCKDIDECLTGESRCSGDRCRNTVGSYTCIPCLPGFIESEDGLCIGTIKGACNCDPKTEECRRGKCRCKKGHKRNKEGRCVKPPGSNREVQSSSAQPSYLGINVSIVITGLFGFMAFTVQATAPLT